MPFPSYDIGDIAVFAEDDEYYDSILEQRRQLLQPVAEPLKMAPAVAQLEMDYRKLKKLCQEIMASLTLPDNAHWFSGLPDDWFMHVNAWKQRLEALDK